MTTEDPNNFITYNKAVCMLSDIMPRLSFDFIECILQKEIENEMLPIYELVRWDSLERFEQIPTGFLASLTCLTPSKFLSRFAYIRLDDLQNGLLHKSEEK
jgi:hypothetical protein